MSEKDIYDMLNDSDLNIQVAYDHFVQNANGKVVPPFILYRSNSSDNFKADDKSYFRNCEYIIDLVTDKKDVSLESSVESLLSENNLPFDKEEDFIESEQIYQIRYFI